MKAVVAAFNQEKVLVGAFSVITNLWLELFEALVGTLNTALPCITSHHLTAPHLHCHQQHLGEPGPGLVFITRIFFRNIKMRTNWQMV